MMSVVDRKPKHQVETEYLQLRDDSESRNLGWPPPVEGLMASLRHSSVMASSLWSCWGLSTLESWEYCIILHLLLFQPGRHRQWVMLEDASLFQLYGVRPRQAGHWIFQSGRELGKEGRKPPHHQTEAGGGTEGGVPAPCWEASRSSLPCHPHIGPQQHEKGPGPGGTPWMHPLVPECCLGREAHTGPCQPSLASSLGEGRGGAEEGPDEQTPVSSHEPWPSSPHRIWAGGDILCSWQTWGSEGQWIAPEHAEK